MTRMQHLPTTKTHTEVDGDERGRGNLFEYPTLRHCERPQGARQSHHSNTNTQNKKTEPSTDCLSPFAMTACDHQRVIASPTASPDFSSGNEAVAIHSKTIAP